MKLNIQEMQKGHKFSELSHYTLISKETDHCTFKHHASGKEVVLANNYILNYIKNEEQYQTEIVVGREDKLWTANQIEKGISNEDFKRKNAPIEGSLRQLGIRTIWENIHSAQVFTVCYEANSKETSKELKKRREEAAFIISSNVNVSSRMKI